MSYVLCNRYTLAVAVRIQDNQKLRQFAKPESVTRFEAETFRMRSENANACQGF
jgi:hypothetical protein